MKFCCLKFILLKKKDISNKEAINLVQANQQAITQDIDKSMISTIISKFSNLLYILNGYFCDEKKTKTD